MFYSFNMAELTLETPQPEILSQGKTILLDVEAPKTYQGVLEKMNVLNREDSKVSAIPFKLRQGVQDGLAFKLDDNNPDRIISPEDVRTPGNDAFVLRQREDGNLSITFGNGKTDVIPQKELEKKTAVLVFNDRQALGVTRYNPNESQIEAYKISLEEDVLIPEPEPLEPTPLPTRKPKIVRWPKLPRREDLPRWFIDFAIPVSLAFPRTVTPIPETPPPAIVEQAPFIPQNPVDTGVVKAPAPKEKPDYGQRKVVPELKKEESHQLTEDEILKQFACPFYEQFTLEAEYPKNSLSGALISVNGRERYLKPDGSFDEELIAKELLCMVANPKNLEVVRKSDPEIAKAIETITQKARQENREISPEELKEALFSTNKTRGKEEWFVKNAVGDTFWTPFFGPEQKTNPTQAPINNKP